MKQHNREFAMDAAISTNMGVLMKCFKRYRHDSADETMPHRSLQWMLLHPLNVGVLLNSFNCCRDISADETTPRSNL